MGPISIYFSCTKENKTLMLDCHDDYHHPYQLGIFSDDKIMNEDVQHTFRVFFDREKPNQTLKY